MKTIIFLSGVFMPSFISKTALFLDNNLWTTYNSVYYESKIPFFNHIADKELNNLVSLVNSYNYPIVIGHSLGGWWAANLACRTDAKIEKIAMWTPLGIASKIPTLFTSNNREPLHKETNLQGKDKIFVAHANRDYIVPSNIHAAPLVEKFKATSFQLNGGHAWQSNHVDGLNQMKNWLVK